MMFSASRREKILSGGDITGSLEVGVDVLGTWSLVKSGSI